MANSRRICFLLGMVFIGLMFVSFKLSYTVQETQSSIHRLKQQLAQEEKSIHVLEAEWAYITRPDRLKRLVAEYTDMVPATQVHLATLAMVKHHTEAVIQMVRHAPQMPATAQRDMQKEIQQARLHRAMPSAPQKLAKSRQEAPEKVKAFSGKSGSVWDVLDPSEMHD